MIRVCVVGPGHSVGGQAIAARTLLEGFATDPRLSLDLQPIDPPLPSWLSRTRGLRTMARLPLYLHGLWNKVHHADVVHVFTAAFWPFALTTTPAVLLARLLKKPVVLNYHDGRAAAHLTSPWVRWVVKQATILVFPSPFLERQFRCRGLEGIVIPNVVDVHRFRFRQRHPLRPVLISCRLLEDLYAVENTLRAFRIIRARFPAARLVVVGSGSRAKAIEEFAARERIEGVEFSGEVPHERMPECFDGADIWVNSSREDNMPLSVIEAFSSGLPVVSTGAGGIPCIVEHERNGLLVPTDDPAALASAVFRLLEEPGLADRLVIAARADCLRHYAWASARIRWFALFAQLAGGHSAATPPLSLAEQRLASRSTADSAARSTLPLPPA